MGGECGKILQKPTRLHGFTEHRGRVGGAPASYSGYLGFRFRSKGRKFGTFSYCPYSFLEGAGLPLWMKLRPFSPTPSRNRDCLPTLYSLRCWLHRPIIHIQSSMIQRTPICTVLTLLLLYLRSETGILKIPFGGELSYPRDGDRISDDKLRRTFWLIL